MVATIFLCLFLQVSVSFIADTIFTNQFLSGNETVISAVGVFELGFFKPGLRFAGLVDLGMASLLVLKQTTEDKSTGKNLYVRLAASELRSSKENNMIVKQLQSLNQGEKQFHAEVSTIGTIQHIDLVQLRGFCSRGTKRLLVYDYMSNGSLDSHLFHKKNLSFLKWETRYQITLGTIRGLLYPHEKCRDCIVRYDIKPDNILLDAEFCPKVADFGMAKLVGRDFSRVLTTMRGTRGYLAPEWISGAAIIAKADVYNY
ncbi:hypothetical protein FNV43_RR12852 [Rhamnella rubrinervis]|uniref:non-specific serine/threonine protein kinase n=1 Tax=Rhamnella rubrinervis TaxID=2594499 RepID=A0A8K0H013_9ROSA|nr:hypothetical protein FNV43_RR12852 [Rhamnella rubrinervis]